MSRRVSRIAATALLALILSLQAPAAYAVPASRDQGVQPGFIERVIKVWKFLIHGLDTTTTDPSAWPSPPKP